MITVVVVKMDWASAPDAGERGGRVIQNSTSS